MKPNEAAELVMMMAASTSTRLLAQEKEIWEEQLLPLDAKLATQTVHYGREVWRKFPSWKDFREVYRMKQRQEDDKLLAAQHAEQRSNVVEIGKRGYAAPEWVWIWAWLRLEKDVWTPLPQERGFTDSAEEMSEEEYERWREKWIAAGSPKLRNPLPMARSI